jgi:hypothetical protein
MSDTQAAAFGVEYSGIDLVVFVDRSCGGCAPCTSGGTLWCARPSVTGRVLTTPFPAVLAPALRTALLGAAALAAAPDVATVLMAVAAEGPLPVLARAASSARLVVGPDLAAPELRAELLRLEPSGRARVVVAAGDVRAAVRAVRRGGFVCVADHTARLPSITELVQREVSLVGARDVAGVLSHLSEADWSAAVAAA